MTKTLGDVLADLSYGPLSNLSIGSEGTGSILMAQETRVIRLVNQGLTRLFSRFVMAQKELTIRTLVGRSVYPLRAVHAESSVGLEYKFIRDSQEEPFTGDVIRVLAVYDCNGEELPLNNEHDEASVFTPKPDHLQIAHTRGGETYHVLYQAAHPKMEPGDPSQEIDLVEPLYEALEAFVAGKILSSMNGQEHQAKGLELMALYDSVCARMNDLDITVQSFATNTTKLEYRGFV